MLRPPPALLPSLVLFTACTDSDAAPGDIIAASSSSDGAGPTAPPTTEAAPSDDPTDANTSATSATTAPDDTTTSAATTATTTEETLDATTGAPLRCGDGALDPGEQCDDSHAMNADDAACTLHCQKAVCGDGLIWADHEACDDGNNNHGKYGGCNPDCTLAPHCGDGERNGPEECDLGDKNGTGEHPIDGVPCSACYHDALLVFLSSQAFAPSQLIGATGADKRCTELATAAGLYGGAAFKAWISDGFSDPASRFEPAVSGMPYALLNGKRIAKDRAALLADGPEDGITMTEMGVTMYQAHVWTDTNPDGTKLLGSEHCENWTKDSPLWKGKVGQSGVDKQDLAAWQAWKSAHYWTTYTTSDCLQSYRLYCFEQ